MIRHFVYTFLSVFCLMVIICWKSLDTSVALPPDRKITTVPPENIQLLYAIEKYSKEYNIPKNYAYGIAYKETRYTWPFQWDYVAGLTSSAGALGPMQVMYKTAKGRFPKKEFDKEYLKNNIDFNVECSMKLLRYLYDLYGNWGLVFGTYNTGKPVINDYARFVLNYDIKDSFEKKLK